MGAVSTVTLQINGEQLPKTIDFRPNPTELSDDDFLMIAAVCINRLAQRHGLEKALDLVNEAGYGRLPKGDEFDLSFRKLEEQN